MRGEVHGHRGHCHEPHMDWGDLAGRFERCGRLLSHCLGKRRGQGRILRTLCQRGKCPRRNFRICWVSRRDP